MLGVREWCGEPGAFSDVIQIGAVVLSSELPPDCYGLFVAVLYAGESIASPKFTISGLE